MMIAAKHKFIKSIMECREYRMAIPEVCMK